MKKLPLKLVRIIFIVVLVLSIPVYLCGYLLSVAALTVLGMAFLAADCVFAFLFLPLPALPRLPGALLRRLLYLLR